MTLTETTSVVKLNEDRITFLDTPGHSAFSSIRKRGAKVTDLIVLVVAAGDGVMAQTREAIHLARQHRVPLVVAINKCDAFGEQGIVKVKQGLMQEQVLLEEFGGEVQAVPISGLTGKGVDSLLEAINAQASLMDLECDHSGPVQATIIETKLKLGQGDAATVIVSKGTLRPGDILVGDESYCRVRSILNSAGAQVEAAGPSEPAEITGWKGRPEAGMILSQISSEQEAQDQIAERVKLRSEIDLLDSLKIAEQREALDDELWRIIKEEGENPIASPRSVRMYDEVQSGSQDKRLTVKLMVKCDTDGSLEAVVKALEALPQTKVCLEFIHTGLGPVTPSEADLAKSSNSILVAFNVLSSAANKKAGLKVIKNRIIYHLIDEIKDEITRRIPPLFKEAILGQAKILQLFPYAGKESGSIAGCSITDGKIDRHPAAPPLPLGLPPVETFLRLKRGDEVLRDRIRILAMKHIKRDISSAGKGMECGILLEDDTGDIPVELEPGDVLIQVQRVPSFDKLE